MKKFLFRFSFLALIFAVFIFYISKNYGALEKTVNVTLSHSLGFLFLAIVFAALAYYFMVLMKKKAFEMMGIKRSVPEMAILQMSSLAVNALPVPSMISVSLLFAGDAHDKGESEAAAVTAIMVALLVDYISIAILLTFATIFLFFVHSLGLTVVIPAVAFYALTVGLYMLIYYAGRNKKKVRGFLGQTKDVANKVLGFFKRKKILKDEAIIDNFVNELENAYGVIAKDREDFLNSIGVILVSHLMYLVVIYVLFISLGIVPLLSVLITGYAIGMMFIVISPTPNGVGFVEGGMAIAYTSMGISGPAALSVALVYRGLSFWLPLLIGFMAIQRKHLLKLIEERGEL